MGLLFVSSIFSVYYALQIKFRFDFEQFFPQGDEDLAFFKGFIEEFETDDNFLLVGIPNKGTVFEKSFLEKIQNTTIDLRDVAGVMKSQSITNIRMPLKTPFGFTSIPLVHLDDPTSYDSDKQKILEDPRFVNALINERADALVIALKTDPEISIGLSDSMIISIKSTLLKNGIDEYHLLGRGYFQSEIVRIQKIEMLLCAIAAIILVSIMMWFIYHKIASIVLTIGCVSVSLLFFLGYMGAFGRDLNLLSALYPVILLIAGTSDIVHILSKYIDEIRLGKKVNEALKVTMKEIGTATLITSVTTSIGFITLMTSRIQPVRDFGLNCAVGVMITYVITVVFSIVYLSYINPDKIVDQSKKSKFWDKWILKTYEATFYQRSKILLFFGIFIILSITGISMIKTNYSIKKNLPLSSEVGIDFLFFEKEFAGFRPLEFAIIAKKPYMATDFEVVREINKIDAQLQSIPEIKGVVSQAMLYKSMVKLENGNQKESYIFPTDSIQFARMKPMVDKFSEGENAILVNKTRDKSRISSKIADIGADSIKEISTNLDIWIAANIDTSIITVKQTGTGLILDKNSKYVVENLLTGLAASLILISLLMSFLVGNWKMAIIAFFPNFVPILFAASLLGWFGIDLEASISIVFGVVYGIVVDDTIHFFGRYKLCLNKGMSIEESIKTTFQESGKAIVFTTLILFFAFLVMLFTSQPLTRTVGALISVTFIAAVVCDLLLLPILIRWFFKGEIKNDVRQA